MNKCALRSKRRLQFHLRRFADAADTRTTLADDNRTLGLSLNVDSLLNPDIAVLKFLPLIRLNGERIGQLVAKLDESLFPRDFSCKQSVQPCPTSDLQGIATGLPARPSPASPQGQ